MNEFAQETGKKEPGAAGTFKLLPAPSSQEDEMFPKRELR